SRRRIGGRTSGVGGVARRNELLDEKNCECSGCREPGDLAAGIVNCSANLKSSTARRRRLQSAAGNSRGSQGFSRSYKSRAAHSCAAHVSPCGAAGCEGIRSVATRQPWATRYGKVRRVLACRCRDSFGDCRRQTGCGGRPCPAQGCGRPRWGPTGGESDAESEHDAERESGPESGRKPVCGPGRESAPRQGKERLASSTKTKGRSARSLLDHRECRSQLRGSPLHRPRVIRVALAEWQHHHHHRAEQEPSL